MNKLVLYLFIVFFINTSCTNNCKKHNTVNKNEIAKESINNAIFADSNCGACYLDYSIIEGKGNRSIAKKSDSSFYEIKNDTSSQYEIIRYIKGEVTSRYKVVKDGRKTYYYGIPILENGAAEMGYLFYIRYGINKVDKIMIAPNDGKPIRYKKITYNNGMITYTSARLNLSTTYEFEKRGIELFELIQKKSLEDYLVMATVSKKKIEDSLEIQRIFVLY